MQTALSAPIAKQGTGTARDQHLAFDGFPVTEGLLASGAKKKICQQVVSKQAIRFLV